MMEHSLAYALAGHGLENTVHAINELKLGAEASERLFKVILEEVDAYYALGYNNGEQDGYSTGWDDAAQAYGEM